MQPAVFDIEFDRVAVAHQRKGPPPRLRAVCTHDRAIGRSRHPRIAEESCRHALLQDLRRQRELPTSGKRDSPSDHSSSAPGCRRVHVEIVVVDARMQASMSSNTKARPVCLSNPGVAAEGFNTAPLGARLPRSTAMPPCGLNGV